MSKQKWLLFRETKRNGKGKMRSFESLVKNNCPFLMYIAVSQINFRAKTSRWLHQESVKTKVRTFKSKWNGMTNLRCRCFNLSHGYHFWPWKNWHLFRMVDKTFFFLKRCRCFLVAWETKVFFFLRNFVVFCDCGRHTRFTLYN